VRAPETTAAPCDLCGGAALEPVYRAPSGRRGVTVHVCGQCGLVQSLPRVDRVAGRPVAVSSGADWGNVRYGKGFRAEATLALLAGCRDLAGVREVLDVGANRGAFIERLRTQAPAARILAVEPDAAVSAPYAALPGVELAVARIEAVALPEARFDLVHCSHTLEHVRSPRGVLAQLHRALAPGGLLFLEVPDLDFVGRDDVVEEWFIDKHLYHFSEDALLDYVRCAGFWVVDRLPDPALHENVTLVVTRAAGAAAGGPRPDPGRAARARALVGRYESTLRRNHAALRTAVARLEAVGAGRVAVWGAGRIFDALVRHGGLDAGRLAAVVDRHLAALGHVAGGRAVLPPEALRQVAPALVVVASRAYGEEIRAELRGLLPGAAVGGPTELLATAAVSGTHGRAAPAAAGPA
jgi:SAM-dependent methyltransferase